MKDYYIRIRLISSLFEEVLILKESITSYSEGDQPWVFFGGTDAKAEAPVLWPPHAKS